MSSLSRVSCHSLHGMSRAEREALARSLYAVHAQIFSGLDLEGFRDYVVDRPSWRTWIYVRHDAAGQLVGYTAIHAFLRSLQGRPATIIRMEAGTLPAARGRDLTMVYGLLRLLRVWARHPLRRACMFAALTHPSSYTFLARYAPKIWPHADRPLPPEVRRQLEELAEAFALERVEAADPLLRQVDWITIETEEERRRWAASRRRDTRFYIERNPRYAEGHGLLTLIPLSVPILLTAMARFLGARAARLLRLALGRDGGRGRPDGGRIPSARGQAGGHASSTRPQQL